MELQATLAVMYSAKRRASLQPESQVKALVLMGLYSVRSERVIYEAMNDDLVEVVLRSAGR